MMKLKTNYEIESIIYRILNEGLKGKINGEVCFQDERSVDSKLEDVVIKTNYITMESFPQSASFTIFAYVPDILKGTGGKKTYNKNRKRLAELSKVVYETIKKPIIEGLAITIENGVELSENDINQHLVAFRLFINIQN